MAGTAASESAGGLQRDRWRLQWPCSPGAQVAGMAALKPQAGRALAVNPGGTCGGRAGGSSGSLAAQAPRGGDLRRPCWWFQWQPCIPGARVIGGTGIDE